MVEAYQKRVVARLFSYGHLTAMVVGLTGFSSLGLTQEWDGENILPQLESELEIMVQSGAATSQDPEKLLKVAGVYLDLGYGVYVEKEKKLRAFREGTRLAKKALEYQDSAKAHFLYAANLGSAAELEGLVSSALTLQELKGHVHRVLELDPGHVQGHHMLGRLYEELPWFLGGNSDEAAKHLKKAVALDGGYAPGRLDLARWYLKQGETDLAKTQLKEVVATPPQHKRWIWRLRHRPEAEALLEQLR